MDISFWKPTTGVIKATIHKSGKLGFSQLAIEKIGLNQNAFVMIGTNKENKKDDSIYLMITEEANEMAMKANKAGQYYYLNTRDFFNELGIDYKKKTVIYDIVEISEEENKVYKLIPREKERKKKYN